MEPHVVGAAAMKRDSLETKQSRQAAVGCLIYLYSLGITGPMWLLLLHEILAAIEARDFLWWVYWTYVPAHLLGVILFGALRVMTDAR